LASLTPLRRLRVLTHGHPRAPFTHRNEVPADSFRAGPWPIGNARPGATLARVSASAGDGGLAEERRTAT